MNRRFTPGQREAVGRAASGNFLPSLVREEDGWHARWISPAGASDVWTDDVVRALAVSPLCEDAEEGRYRTLHDAWLAALQSRTGLVRWDDAECAEFAEELSAWRGEDLAGARASLEFRFGVGDAAGFEISLPIPRGERALKALGEAVCVVGTLRGLRRRTDCLVVPLDRGEAEDFIHAGAKELRDAGYRVTGVDLAAPVEVSADVEAGETPRTEARAKFEVRVAGQVVTAAEVRFLLEQGSSLVFFRDHWIEVDRGILREALRALERAGSERLPPVAALRFAVGLGSVGRLEVAATAAGGWVKGLLSRMRARGESVLPDELGLGAELFGTLRGYQRRGVRWLRFMTDHGFGALLADDMGLGKTLQTIAWTVSDRAAHPDGGAVLVVAPLSLLTNWQREFARFAPGLEVYVHQGEGRHVASGFRRTALASDVVITGYSLLVRDYDAIAEVKWRALVLDEAQTVKNPDTKVSAAARALLPPKRLALTGTPVENSVADIWSIEEFLNPGLLGERKAFEERFVRPLAFDPRAAAGRRLKEGLEPFVLRRLKGEADVAAELAPKTVTREWCRLAPADRAAYETALADFRAGEHRPGDSFALLTALKLACDGEGKRERLFGILDGVLAAGEAALVFTQYAKVGAQLAEELRARYGAPVQFLHGALTVREREREIAAFNARAGRIFVLSLKAGGFGLNLTKATHVVHFDRWWNPAVENQATDRAHRIGQTKPVFVHLLVSTGTVEERVDRILAHKSSVSETLVTSGESFLLSLAPDEFERVVGLEAEP